MKSAFVPEIVTPVQYFDSRRVSSELDPIKRLMMAVLTDAVRCYQNAPTASGCERRSFQEAERWLFDDRGDELFSFEQVSETLGLDPQCLRSGLKQWHQRTREQGSTCRLGRRSPVLGSGGRR